MQAREPVYVETHRRGVLQAKIDAAYEILRQCTLCPRNCRIDRHHGELGVCRTGDRPIVSSYAPHFGEEDPLVGSTAPAPFFLPTATCTVFFVRTTRSATEGKGRRSAPQIWPP